LGKTEEEIIGKTETELFAAPEIISFFSDEGIIQSKIPVIEKREYVHNADNNELVLTTSKLPFYDNNGHLAGIVGSGLDITKDIKAEYEIKALNESLDNKVKERTLQLARANEELEAFAYSVSHDLRAPLRHIDGFMKLLTESITQRNNKIDKYIDIINKSTGRMSVMIDDLLNFSRLGRKQLTLEELNMNLLVKEVIEQFKPDIENRNLTIDLQPIPNMLGDRGLIKIVFENLISNAIKYTSKVEKAIISIGCETNNSKPEVYVKDNGAGFDMQYAQQLFGVFHRMHSYAEFEGTGIGLANVKQIINKHNGTIRAYAEVNKGAAFYFSLSLVDSSGK
jgi:light-regulated signal transduction histidine kinase (bacteriophytochrome)